MKRQMQSVIVTTAAIAITFVSSTPADAFGGRLGGRVRASIGRRIGSPILRAPAHHHVHPPVCHQRPVVHVLPAPPQPIHVQSVAPQSIPRQSVPPQPLSSQGVVRSNQGASNGPLASAPALHNTTQQVSPSSQSATALNTNTDNSEASALAMLASISNNENSTNQATTQIPEFAATSQQTTGTHVGNWVVSLPGNQSVALTLNEDGSFVWTATKDSKSSSFQGQFRLENGRLTLVRANDLQQMTGSWSGAADKFTFKLDGATTSGLAFARG